MAVQAFAPGLVLVDSGGIPITNAAKPEYATPFVVVAANAPAATLVAEGGYPVALLNPDGTAYVVG